MTKMLKVQIPLVCQYVVVSVGKTLNPKLLLKWLAAVIHWSLSVSVNFEVKKLWGSVKVLKSAIYAHSI